VFGAAWSVVQSMQFNDVRDIVGTLACLHAYDGLAEALRHEPRAARPETALSERVDATASTPAAPPRVRFEDVSFAYPGTDRLVLDRLNLEIRPGELLAIVGLNGAGKSTLIKLLAGLYTPTGGRITVDGIDIDDIGPAAWRERISVVFQDFVRYEL